MKNEDKVLASLAHQAVASTAFARRKSPVGMILDNEPHPVARVESYFDERVSLWRALIEIEIEDRMTGEKETRRVVTVYAVGDDSDDVDFVWDNVETIG